MSATTDVIVLAAGVGRRLGMADRPKWLVPIGDASPAVVHLDAFEQLPDLGRVLVVAGHAAEAVEAVVADRTALDIAVLRNPHYADRNNWYSLQLALEAWLPTGADGTWIVNSDLCAAPSWFVKALATPPPADGGLVCDRRRELTDEAMKVAVRDQCVVRIGKQGVDEPVGEYVGVTWLRRDAAVGLHAHLASFDSDPAAADNWYEHAIQRHIDAGGAYAVVDVPDGRWVEIDVPDEVDVAVGLLTS